MKVTITDDKKGKYQSVEAVGEISFNLSNAHIHMDCTGYGETREEALAELRAACKRVECDIKCFELG